MHSMHFATWSTDQVLGDGAARIFTHAGAEPTPMMRPPSAYSDTHGDPPRDPKPTAITGIPRSGYSNGHGHGQRAGENSLACVDAGAMAAVYCLAHIRLSTVS
jgi:hypothetical protein